MITDSAMIVGSLRAAVVSDYRSSASVIRSCPSGPHGQWVILPIGLRGLPIPTIRRASDLHDYRSAYQYPFPAYASAHAHAIRSGMRPDPASVIGNPIMNPVGGPR